MADFEDVRERLELEALLRRLQSPSVYSAEAIRRRADELVALRFGVADAAHVAFAEALADVMISCDDDLVKKCRKHVTRIKAFNPVDFASMEGLK